MKKVLLMLALGLLFTLSAAFTYPTQKYSVAELHATQAQISVQSQGVVETVLNGAEEAWKTWIYPAVIGVGSSATLVGVVGLCLNLLYKRRKKKADANSAESEKIRLDRDKKRDEALARLIESNAQINKTLIAQCETIKSTDLNLQSMKKTENEISARIRTVMQILSAVYGSSDALSPEIRQYVVAKVLEAVTDESDG